MKKHKILFQSGSEDNIESFKIYHTYLTDYEAELQ